MPSNNTLDLADQVSRAPLSETHKQPAPKQSRQTELQAPNKKPKLAVKPHKLPAAHQPTRKLPQSKSETAAQVESKPWQVGTYDRPWRKHMKATSTDRQTGQQEAAAATAAPPARDRQPAGSKVIIKQWCKVLVCCSICLRVLLSQSNTASALPNCKQCGKRDTTAAVKFQVLTSAICYICSCS